MRGYQSKPKPEPNSHETDIPPVPSDEDIPVGSTCQEASMLSKDNYVPCGIPATSIVYHIKDRRSYYMCTPCADHNVNNRGGVLKFQYIIPSIESIEQFKKDQRKKADKGMQIAVPIAVPTKTKAGSRVGFMVPVPVPSESERSTKPTKHAKPAETRADEFPNISTFDRTGDMQTALALMQLDLEYQEQEAAIKAARADCKLQLAALADYYSIPGMRWGQLVVYHRGMKTRPTTSLDKFIQALLEHAVESSVVDECKEEATSESKPYLDLQVKDLSKGKGKKED